MIISTRQYFCTIYGDKNVYELSKLCTRFWLAEETISFKDFNSTA